MARKQARILPTIEEKRYYTLQFLEAAVVGGSEVKITPVETHDLTELSSELFTYNTDKAINTYIIFDERPKPQLLKTLGWYREDEVPIIAYAPTHILREAEVVTEPELSITKGQELNYYVLDNTDITQLVHEGYTNKEDSNYVLDPLQLIRGTKIDIFYDFLPKVINPENPSGDLIDDPKGKVNTFFVTEAKVDVVSLNYVLKLMPFRYNIEKAELEIDPEEENMEYLKFNSEDFGL